MGSCIGTCGPKEPPQDEDLHEQVHVQDKTDPIAPPSPSSLSSFSCNTTITSSSSSLSSTSSSASSILTSKVDRTFSNEFLWTCIKDNPHIIQEKGKPMSHVVQVLAPSMTTPKKRVRSGSPNLTRHKSFRKDPPPPQPDLSSYYYAPTRTSLRSPSPSRRFNGGSNKVNSNPTKSLSLAKNKDNLRPQSPDCYSQRSSNLSSTSGRVAAHRSGLRNREAVSVSNNVNGSRLDEATGSVGVAKVEDDILMEDILNPLISLDCFIFL